MFGCLPFLVSFSDTFHKPGFKQQAHILHLLFNVLDTPAIKASLWDATVKVNWSLSWAHLMAHFISRPQ
jgi:hypothetical protein